MSINIGDKNKIKNVSIIDNSTGKIIIQPEKKRLAERHPVLIGLFCSFVIGILLMFSFWQELVQYIERLL